MNKTCIERRIQFTLAVFFNLVIMGAIFLALALSLTCIHATYTIEDFDVIQATDNAQINAKNYGSVTTFHAPKNGTIAGIRLRYIEGSVSCDKYYDDSYTKWGCAHGPFKFFTMFLRVTDRDSYVGELYYPQSTTQVICSI